MKRRYLLAAIFLFLTGVWFWQHRPISGLKIYFFDVGQGDAILISTPQGNNILIDGGPNRKILQQLAKALPYGDRTIDLVISTHPHADHLAGLLAVLEEYQVKKILGTGVVHTTNDYLEWLKQIKDKNIVYQVVRAGDDINFTDGVNLHILWPEENLVQKRVEDLNDTSIVLRVEYEKTSALLTGDISQAVEQRLVSSGNDLTAQILKIAHQGSHTSSSREFLQAVAPVWAVIMVGVNNRYGHPHLEILNRLKILGIRIWRTDLQGGVIFVSNGNNWQQQSF